MVNAQASRACSERFSGSSPDRRTTLTSRSGGMVDTLRLERSARKGVPVRVRPSVPNIETPCGGIVDAADLKSVEVNPSSWCESR